MRTRTVLFGTLVVGVVAASALPAAAHVDIAPADDAPVEPFSDATLTVRVPNEREVGTVGVELVFPEVFEEVTVQPTPGWAVEAEHDDAQGASSASAVPIVPVHDDEEHPDDTAPPGTGASGSEPTDSAPPVLDTPEVFENVSALVWAGGPTGPDETAEFVITVGPIPDTPTLVFKAVQIYESGEEVRWIQEPSEGGEALEFPAPVLEVDGATPENFVDDGPELVDEESDGDSDWWKPALIGLAVLLIVGGLTARVVTQRRMSRGDAEGADGADVDGADAQGPKI